MIVFKMSLSTNYQMMYLFTFVCLTKKRRNEQRMMGHLG
jgi:hypothetical protein